MANTVVTALEQRGLTCWIAPRDVTPGGSYAESILTAIETSSCFVLIYSEHSNVSSHVLREVERALKFGVNIVPVRFDDSTPSKSLDYLLATVHWLSIPSESRERSIGKAAEQIAEWITNFMENPATPLPLRISTVQTALVTNLHAQRRGHGLIASIVLLIAAAVALATGHLRLLKDPEDKSASVTVPAAVPLREPVKEVRALGRSEPSLRAAPNVRKSIGYAGVSNAPTAGPNGPAGPQGPPPGDPRMQNHSGQILPPPPPPGMPMPPNDNPSGFGPGYRSNGGYPPPPPPGPGRRPMFGPGNGPGQPPNGPEPRP